MTRIPARDGPAGWGWVTRALHWTLAGLIFFQLGLGLRMAAFTPDLAARFTLTQLHKSWGAVILALVLARIAWRLSAPGRPPIPGPRWEARAARASHAGLYALLLVLPVSGWVAVSASPIQDMLGIDNTVFGLLALPDPWVPGDAGVERAAGTVHLCAAVALAALLALHVAAALRHHFARRDGVLAGMTFGR
ncbi:cytochrome b/b6 domain-containing protein [Amaricoccus sp.]|uniref:cytochrome b n=1 Tax=Amaricoccus sp. TaxID=1872485 RepID=UPI001B467614|nr:cytochrome b/b6 domain-containing protein [Amaricoccus sp.]MBP7001976.1 cytochrome b [Amaricoccus sp.]